MKFQIDNFRNNKKNRTFHDDVNDRFNKFLKNKNRDKKRKNRNKRRKNRKNNTFVIDLNIDFVEREKKQKKHDERQIKKFYYKCEFTNHFIEICSKYKKNQKIKKFDRFHSNSTIKK